MELLRHEMQLIPSGCWLDCALIVVHANVGLDRHLLNCRLCRLEDSREFERAAAIAVFTLKVSRAIEVLRHGAMWRQSHRMLNHFLAGFPNE